MYTFCCPCMPQDVCPSVPLQQQIWFMTGSHDFYELCHHEQSQFSDQKCWIEPILLTPQGHVVADVQVASFVGCAETVAQRTAWLQNCVRAVAESRTPFASTSSHRLKVCLLMLHKRSICWVVHLFNPPSQALFLGCTGIVTDGRHCVLLRGFTCNAARHTWMTTCVTCTACIANFNSQCSLAEQGLV